MKRIITAILAALLIVGVAYAGPEMDFELNAIENSTARGYGASYPDFACQVTNRTGIGNIVLELQGSIKPDLSNALTFVALANSAVVNTTDAGTDNSSWHFQSFSAAATSIRMKVLSGAGVANTVTGVCRPVGR